MTIKHLRDYILGMLACSMCAHADLKSDIGYTRLQAELNSQRLTPPDGSGIQVLLAEACGNLVDDDNDPETPPICLAWLPNLLDNQFQGKILNDISLSTTGLFSSHATGVARLFFGNSSSIAPGIDRVDAYFTDHWLEEGYLQTEKPALLPTISSNRIANHSWVGTVGTTPEEQLNTRNILRRVDWLIERDEFIQVVGLTNSSQNQALLSSAFNVVSVGRSDGLHGQGTVAVDSIYRVGRARPDLVAPLSTTSSATPVISAAAALLVETGHSDASLSTDLHISSTFNRAGDTIYNAERSEVIKAVLMAGADRTASTNKITDYRSTASTQTTNGLDSRFGAGQVNIANSYHILIAGEQNSVEDAQSGVGSIHPSGFDYDPLFGGATSHSEASYKFSTGSEKESFYVSLVWNISIKEGQNGGFDGTAHLYDLNLNLIDITGNPTLVASSSSDNENTENLWAALNSNHDYILKVVTGPNQTAFDWDYAIAWRREADTDHDGIANLRDNCILVANADQKDTDGDGFGNPCDGDLNNDFKTNTLDLNLYKLVHRTKEGNSKYDPNADFNNDGEINTLDLNIYKNLHRNPPGPSGFVLNQ